MLCKSCGYWEEIKGSQRGSCCRYPPRVVVVKRHYHDPDVKSLFPLTNTEKFCGEWIGKGEMR